MSFRATGCPDIRDFGGDAVRWAAALTEHLNRTTQDLEADSASRDRATVAQFTITNLGAGSMTLDVSTATAAQVAAFVGSLIKTLQKRRIIKAAVS